MSGVLDPQLKRALAKRVRFYNELGIYDFYRRRGPVEGTASAVPDSQPEPREEMPRSKAAVAVSTMEPDTSSPAKPEAGVSDPAKALRIIREDIGDCTRCVLHKQGRK